MPAAPGQPSLVLCEPPQTGVLLPWLRPWRRTDEADCAGSAAPPPAMPFAIGRSCWRRTMGSINRLARFEDARAYLAKRGIHDPAVIERMRIGYAPGACLRGYLARLGYGREALRERGLIDDAGPRCVSSAVSPSLWRGRESLRPLDRQWHLPSPLSARLQRRTLWLGTVTRFSPRHRGRRPVRCGGFVASRFSQCGGGAGIASQQRADRGALPARRAHHLYLFRCRP